jgi:hypothetical protein
MTDRTIGLCPASPRPGQSGCPEASACRAEPGTLMPHQGAERAVMLALRFIAAAADTGDAACWDAALDGAEAAFGPRDGALLVARAAALLRAMRREGAGLDFLPPPCRRLSADEADLLGAFRARLQGRDTPMSLSADLCAALTDLLAPLAPSCPYTPLPALARSAPPLHAAV